MVPTQAELKSLANPEDIKGIGPSLGKELRDLGINSVGDFLTTDPTIIGEKTRVSQEMAETLQSIGQLMMVPGVNANDAEILLEAGIKSRKALAGQDLINLCRKVNKIAKIYVDQGKISKEEYPTIEEVSSWIRMAR
jgi:predicted RecB family nuclease